MEVYLDHNSRVLLLCKEGNKHYHVVRIAPSGVVADTYSKLDKSETMDWRPAMLKDKPYPVRRAIKHFRKIGRVRGITKKAKQLLATSC